MEAGGSDECSLIAGVCGGSLEAGGSDDSSLIAGWGGGSLEAGFSDDSSLIAGGLVDHWRQKVVMIAR